AAITAATAVMFKNLMNSSRNESNVVSRVARMEGPTLCGPVIRDRRLRSYRGRPRISLALHPGYEPAARSRVDPGNRQKFFRIQPGAAAQRAVNISDRHQLLGIRRLHRAAVQDAYALRGPWKPCGEPLADEAVDLGDVGWRRGEPGADRPYGLIGNDKVLG